MSTVGLSSALQEIGGLLASWSGALAINALKGLCLHHLATNCLAWEALDLLESQCPHLRWGEKDLHLTGHRESERNGRTWTLTVSAPPLAVSCCL